MLSGNSQPKTNPKRNPKPNPYNAPFVNRRRRQLIYMSPVCQSYLSFMYSHLTWTVRTHTDRQCVFCCRISSGVWPVRPRRQQRHQQRGAGYGDASTGTQSNWRRTARHDSWAWPRRFVAFHSVGSHRAFSFAFVCKSCTLFAVDKKPDSAPLKLLNGFTY